MPDHIVVAKVLNSSISGGLRGSSGNAVFVQSRYGTILREKPFPRRDSPSAAQTANRVRMQKVGAAWRSLSMSQALAWQAYGQAEAGGESAEVALPQLIFNRLAMRFLQVSPSLPIPLDPPTSAFPGDSVRVSLATSPGALVVTAQSANAPGVVTEILLQRLDSPLRRTYERKYVAAQFVALTRWPKRDLPGSSRSLGGGDAVYAGRDRAEYGLA